MKAKEVIAILNDMKGVFGTRGHEQYSLPALDLAIESLEKQIDKEPVWGACTNEAKDNAKAYCPRCDYYFKDEENYCPDCGQKILWP